MEWLMMVGHLLSLRVRQRHNHLIVLLSRILLYRIHTCKVVKIELLCLHQLWVIVLLCLGVMNRERQRERDRQTDRQAEERVTSFVSMYMRTWMPSWIWTCGSALLEAGSQQAFLTIFLRWSLTEPGALCSSPIYAPVLLLQHRGLQLYYARLFVWVLGM